MISPSVRPRDAGSLVLVRYGSEGPEVLMGRRHSTLAFMPNAYVFPGGKVSAGDGRVQAGSPLNPDFIRHMAVAGRSAHARALAMAAVRETFEETGLMLGEPGEIGPVDSTTWEEFQRLGLAPALGKLDYVCRAITPAPSSIRFHARFFMADAVHLTGTLEGSGELLDLHWAPLRRANRLPIADVTEFVLSEVISLLGAHPDRRARKGMFTHRRHSPYVRYSS